MKRPKFVDEELGDLETLYEEHNLTVKTLGYIEHLEKKLLRLKRLL